MGDRLAVTGAAVVTSLGLTLDATWSSLVAGSSGIRLISRFDASGFRCRRAAEVSSLDPESLEVGRREASIMGQEALRLLKAARDAMSGAGLGGHEIEAERLGFFTAMDTVDPEVEDLLPAVAASVGADGVDYDRFFGGGYREIHPLWPLSTLNNVGFCLVCSYLRVLGENAVFSPGGEAAVTALAEAATVIREGRADVILVGGAGGDVSPGSLARDHLLAGEGTWLEDHPPGEAGAVVVVETEARAKERRVARLAVITGWGQGRDSEPSRGLARAVTASMTQAGLDPSEIDAIVVHGIEPDLWWEAGAFPGLRGRGSEMIPVWASESALGRLSAAAAAVDMCLGVQMLETGVVPPTLAPGGEIGSTGDIGRPEDIQRVMVGGCSRGGQCAAVILERAG